MNPTLTALRANPILQRAYRNWQRWQPHTGRGFLDEVLYNLNQRSDLTVEESALRNTLQKMPRELREAHSRNFGN